MNPKSRPLPMSPETVEGLTDLGRAIRDARLARRLRQKDLSSRVGISVATLKRLERGDPTLAIGRVLEVLTTLSPDLLADLVGTVRADPAGDSLRRKAKGERSKRDDF